MEAFKIRIRVVRASELAPELIRECAGLLTPSERAAFSRMHDPREADVRAVLRAGAGRRRAAGSAVSIAHSGRFGVSAVSNSPVRLGVDCEPRAGEIPDDDLVRDITSPEEFAAWSVLAEESRRPAFARLWTLKEAVLKARGAGLAGGMETVRLRPDFSGLAEPGWFSSFVEVDDSHAVALVWRGGPAEVFVESFADAASF